jgi:hypothetical protein
MADKDTEKTSKQPFVSQADRPEVRLKSDTPLTELRVRDLAYLLGQIGGTRKDFWDGKDWQKDDYDGPLVIKGWKEEKEFKDKDKEKDKEKEKEKEKEKLEKPEKPEGKEHKVEKLELDGVFEPGTLRGPDPRLDQVVQALSGLTARVAQLADQVEELKKARGG